MSNEFGKQEMIWIMLMSFLKLTEFKHALVFGIGALLFYETLVKCCQVLKVDGFLFLSLCCQIVDYFSYEHFYVIYCKFWELDTDHDLLIDEKDLMRHNNHGKQAISEFFSVALSKGVI